MVFNELFASHTENVPEWCCFPLFIQSDIQTRKKGWKKKKRKKKKTGSKWGKRATALVTRADGWQAVQYISVGNNAAVKVHCGPAPCAVQEAQQWLRLPPPASLYRGSALPVTHSLSAVSASTTDVRRQSYIITSWWRHFSYPRAGTVGIRDPDARRPPLLRGAPSTWARRVWSQFTPAGEERWAEVGCLNACKRCSRSK